MKRKHPPPPLTIGIQEILNFILAPQKSRNKEVDEIIDFILSQPPPQPDSTTLTAAAPPPDETVQDLLDWLDSIWVDPETNQDPPCGAIPRSFPWAADHRGTKIHTLEYIMYTLNISTVSADFKCNICGDVENIEYNIAEKYVQISCYIDRKGPTMGGVATNSWMFPTRPQCKKCENKRWSLGKVITENGSSINWLFLLMGKLIGCCKVNQLKQFCEHNGIKCDGQTKPRLVYLTYMGLCKQLDPRGNYDL